MQLSPEALRRTEQRAVVLQLERLMGYPMVRERVEAGQLTLHGWHYVIEDGEVHVFDVRSGGFVAASQRRAQRHRPVCAPTPRAHRTAEASAQRGVERGGARTRGPLRRIARRLDGVDAVGAALSPTWERDASLSSSLGGAPERQAGSFPSL